MTDIDRVIGLRDHLFGLFEGDLGASVLGGVHVAMDPDADVPPVASELAHLLGVAPVTFGWEAEPAGLDFALLVEQAIAASAPNAVASHLANVPQSSTFLRFVSDASPSQRPTNDALLLARAVQLFSPGTPHVHLADLVASTADSPEQDELTAAQLKLVRLRSAHRAFLGSLRSPECEGPVLYLTWVDDDQWCQLRADFFERSFEVRATTSSGTVVTVMTSGSG